MVEDIFLFLRYVFLGIRVIVKYVIIGKYIFVKIDVINDDKYFVIFEDK